jgi:peptide/nickel transport system substrate-binding protein
VKTYKHDPEMAKKLVKESGYKGERLQFLGLPYGETWSRWAEAIKQNFADVGINMDIVSTDVPGWTQRTSNHDFDLTFNFLYQLGDPATGVARSYVSTNIVKGNPFGNVGGYANPEVDKLFAEAAIAPAEGRQALYTKLQQVLAEELPVLWLLELDFPTCIAATSRTWSRRRSASTTRRRTSGRSSGARLAARCHGRACPGHPDP